MSSLSNDPSESSEISLPAIPYKGRETFSCGKWSAEALTLGPVEGWNRTLNVKRCDLNRMTEIISQTASASGLPIVGAITEHDGYLAYHMSRIPRRSDLEVVSIEKCEGSFAALKMATEAAGFEVHEVDNNHGLGLSIIRALIGLTEGSPGSTNNSPVVHHSPYEMVNAFDSSFKITPALIYSVRPSADESPPAIQKEWATYIICGNSHKNLAKVASVAHWLKQPRFSVEYLGLYFVETVEFPDYL